MSETCPCGHPLKLKPSRNLGLRMDTEILVCMCGRTRTHRDIDDVQRLFIQKTHKRFGKEVPLGCKLNETSLEIYKRLTDSL